MSNDEMVNKLFEELQRKADEIQEIYATLQTLKKYGANIELPELSSFLVSNGSTIPTANISILPDEFFGLSNTDATERYLRRVGHAVSLGEIYNALSQGGIQFSGEGRKSLYVQLIRATRKFVKIGKGQGISFGLLEWYPKAKGKIMKALEEEEQEIPEQSTEDNEEQETQNK
jgi:hypothetical protein